MSAIRATVVFTRFMSLVTLAVLASAVATFLVGTTAGASPPTDSYHFTLTKGAGTPVCDAYLKRLNTADYKTPPYCDIPEATSVPGFTPLHRVPLTAEQIAVIQPHIAIFGTNGQQGSKEGVAKLNAQMGATPDDRLHFVEWMLQYGTKFWRYDPPVDIDNNGDPDNVLIVHEGRCGIPEQTSHYEKDGRTATLAYILAPGNDLLDIPKTKAIFGHPSGGYPLRLFNGSPDPRFRPIGPTIGIFQYQDIYYIDTFLFDNPLQFWGMISDPGLYNPKQADTLAVFLRQHGRTRRVCEYHMTDQ